MPAHRGNTLPCGVAESTVSATQPSQCPEYSPELLDKKEGKHGPFSREKQPTDANPKETQMLELEDKDPKGATVIGSRWQSKTCFKEAMM